MQESRCIRQSWPLPASGLLEWTQLDSPDSRGSSTPLKHINRFPLWLAVCLPVPGILLSASWRVSTCRQPFATVSATKSLMQGGLRGYGEARHQAARVCRFHSGVGYGVTAQHRVGPVPPQFQPPYQHEGILSPWSSAHSSASREWSSVRLRRA